jgi:long-chain acyl-CoA synthetase
VGLPPPPAPVTADDLLAHASATLARYELPAEIRIVETLPRTPSAKVDLAAVSALLAESLTTEAQRHREN